MNANDTSSDSPEKGKQRSISSVTKWLLIALGSLALALGVVGVFVPLLPTTPFLLAAAACYLRSSERMYRWLIRHRWLGSFITNYRQHRAITKSHKILALTLLWATIGYSSLWAIRSPILRISLLAIAIGITAHVLSLRTWKKRMEVTESAQRKQE